MALLLSSFPIKKSNVVTMKGTLQFYKNGGETPSPTSLSMSHLVILTHQNIIWK